MNPVTIEEIKIEQGIFTNIWNLYKKYRNLSTDEEWNEFLKESNDIYVGSYKGYSYEEMFRDMLQVLIKQLERNGKGKNATKES